MPRTIGSVMENHRVAAERRAAGKPLSGWIRPDRVGQHISELLVCSCQTDQYPRPVEDPAPGKWIAVVTLPCREVPV